MPELVEIEVLRRDLEKEVVGRRIKDAEIRPGTKAMKIIPKHGRRKEIQDLLNGAKVEKVERVGRSILLELDNEHHIVIDLDGSGQLVKTSASDPVVTHTHVVLSFTIGGQLRLIDPKATSELYVMPDAELDDLRGSQSHVIDPLTQQLTWQHFSAVLDEKERTLGELVSDERFLCGLGDLYTDEVLWAAGLRHDRPSDKLSSQDVRRLYRGLMETLQDAVKARGTSIGDAPFTDLQGQPGTFQLELKVYEREGEPCRRCRNLIVTEKGLGRLIYFCPQCQS